MTYIILRLNDNKIRIIYLASRHCVKSIKTPELQMGASSITPNGSVKNLGVIFNKSSKMYKQSHQYAELSTLTLAETDCFCKDILMSTRK